MFSQIDDRIRYFAEECDNLQGFHLLSDSGRQEKDSWIRLLCRATYYLSDWLFRTDRVSNMSSQLCLAFLLNAKCYGWFKI